MNREDVEALLAACSRDRIGPHPDNETLASLCRRWLAVEDAEIGRRYAVADDDWIVTPDEDGGVDHPYVRVRIVPDGAADRLLQQEPTNQPQEGKSNA